MTDQATKFLDLFDPRREAYGSSAPAAFEGEKRTATYQTVKQTLTAEIVDRHFIDEANAIGLYALRDDERCKFGVIDIDKYDDPDQLRKDVVAKVARYNLPLLICRSKSGGLHCYWIVPKPVKAQDMRQILKLWANLLGYPGVEIFPKQDKLLSGQFGNFINAPLAGISAGMTDRAVISADGALVTDLDQAIAYAETRVAELKAPPVADGPPCVQRMILEGVKEGARNVALFNFGIYAKLKYGDDYDDHVDDFNRDNIDSSLRRTEVTKVIQSLARKEYAYQCDQEPCASLCNRGLCKRQKYGVGNLQEVEEDAVLLPSHQFPARESAELIFQKFKEHERLYLRGGEVSQIVDGKIEIIRPNQFRTIIEEQGPTYKRVVARGNHAGRIILQRSAVSKGDADVILECDIRREILPEIKIVSQVPLLNADGSIMSPGFNDGGVYVMGACAVPVIPYEEAVADLLELISEFEFLTESDRSRAFAMLITPAMRMSGMLNCPVPLDYSDAQKSQSGKTLRQAMVRSIYRAPSPLGTDRKGGVGSFDESLSTQYIKGYPFICFDNFRGKLDSQLLEAALTAPDGKVMARIPRQPEIECDISRVIHQFSSNDARLTPDLANRACIVSIGKRPRDYQFKRDDPLGYVRANQAHLLGCVYAVVRDWINRGSPIEDHADHDLRVWDRTLSNIISNAGLPGMMVGHRSKQDRTQSPALSWLRAVASNMRPFYDYTATTILEEIISVHDIEWPREPPNGDKKALMMIGQLMAKAFSDADDVSIDDFMIHREVKELKRDDGEGYRTVKLYSRDHIDGRDEPLPY